MPSLEYQGIVWNLEKFNYGNGAVGLRLSNKNTSTYITNNISTLYMGQRNVLIRDYGATKGVYDWLLNNGIVEKYTSEKIIIGDKKAKICKLLI